MRALTILIALITVFVIGFMGPARAETAIASSLRDTVVVDDQYIRLGDLFTNVGEKADAAVAYAPAPGRQAVFDARWLYRVARAHGVAWQPAGSQVRAVVERDSNIILHSDIESAIQRELAARGVAEKMEIELNNRSLRLHVEPDTLAAVAVEDMVYDQATNRFVTVIAYPANDPAAKRLRLTGRAYRVIEVPVLTRPVLPGEQIEDSDLQWINLRTEQLRRDTATEAEHLLGMTPVRQIRVGKPVRLGQVRKPVLVPKRSVVTMVLKRPLMTITAQGRAMEDGSIGDTIRVTNVQSSTVVDALVVGPGKVTVAQPFTVAAN